MSTTSSYSACEEQSSHTSTLLSPVRPSRGRSRRSGGRASSVDALHGVSGGEGWGRKRLESWRSAKLVHRPPICVRILFRCEQYAVEVKRTQQSKGQSDMLRKSAKFPPWCPKSGKLSQNCVGHPETDLTNLKGPRVQDLFQTV